MPKHPKATESRRIALDLLHGGKSVPQGLMRQHLDGIQRRLEAQLEGKSALEREIAKYRLKLHKPVAKRPPQDAAAAQALAELRAIPERLAKRNLLVPAQPRELGGILAGSYSLRITPPYDFGKRFGLYLLKCRLTQIISISCI